MGYIQIQQKRVNSAHSSKNISKYQQITTSNNDIEQGYLTQIPDDRKNTQLQDLLVEEEYTHTAVCPVNVKKGEGEESFVPLFGEQVFFELDKVCFQVDHFWRSPIRPEGKGKNCSQKIHIQLLKINL